MKNIKSQTKKIIGTFFVLALAFGVVVTATYKQPAAAYPANSTEPIDISSANQAKNGGLSVNAFLSRGNTQVYGTTRFVGSVQSGNTPDTIKVGNATDVTGEIHAAGIFNSQTLTHNEAQPKEICGSENGYIIFCDQKIAAVGLINAAVTPKNQNLICSASLSGASANGDQLTLRYEYQYVAAGGHVGPRHFTNCSLNITKGQSSITDDPGTFVFNDGPAGSKLTVNNVCVQSSTAQNNSGIKGC